MSVTPTISQLADIAGGVAELVLLRDEDIKRKDEALRLIAQTADSDLMALLALPVRILAGRLLAINELAREALEPRS